MNFSALLNSRCPYRPRPAVLGIALALALAVLSVSALASIQIKAPDRKRLEAAVAEVRGSAGVELVTRNAIPNERGDTIVHANQTVQGHRVWGSQAVISTGRSGTRMTASSLHAGATPAGTPLLTRAQAIAIATKKMALRGAGPAPKSELIVFPTKYTGGVKFTVDPKTRQYKLDRVNSVVGVHVGGSITADGAWTPDNTWGFHAMTVVSNADPLQFAEGELWVVDGDADADTEFDAIDLGGVALSWGLTGWINASQAILQQGRVDSLDVQAIDQAFKNAFGGL